MSDPDSATPHAEHVAESIATPPPDQKTTATSSYAQSIKWWAAVGSCIFLYSISLAAYMCLVSLTSIINADVGPDESYTWIAPAWTVAAGTGMVVAGALSDVLGRRWFCIGTGLTGILAAIIGGVAPNVPTVIVSFVFLGLNQAGAVNSFAAVAELVARKHRGYIIGAMNESAVFWVVCGSYFGRRMTIDTDPSWRSIYWMILVCNVVGTVVLFFTYYPQTPLAIAHGHSYKNWADFDWIGLAGVIIGPTLFLVGVINIPNYSSTDAHFLAPFISGTICILLLGWYEGWMARQPLLHPFLFRRWRTFTAILVVAFVGGMLFYSLQSWFPAYLEMVLGEDAIQVGIDTMPLNAGTNIGGVGSAVLLPILGPRIGTTPMLVLGVALQFVFIPLMCVPGITGRGAALAISTLGGIGIGIVELLSILLVTLATPDEWIGFATGSLGLLRCMGGATGTAIYSAILLSKSKTLVPQYVSDAVLRWRLSEASTAQLTGILTGAVPGDPMSVDGVTPAIVEAAQIAVREAYRKSFSYIWLSSIAFAVISLGCALGTKDLSSALTLDVAQRLQDSNTEKDEEAGSALHMEVVDVKNTAKEQD
ncbi:hypothetical protein FE257_010694 [Aspergillus nanangensis]|uniref:Major facilitator superfamily (MFS) profile domain-containing protein n=1 Tax=Aspergillus nanangensis TaxID=2582783 RepID=A0AAD4CJJ8_ASPNN|nr:hypothetical protein FE257_010694 [Aspergillus nanangensis]